MKIRLAILCLLSVFMAHKAQASPIILFNNLGQIVASNGPIVFDAVSSAATSGIGTQLAWSHATANQPNRIIIVGFGSDGGGGTAVTSVSYGSLQLLRATASIESGGSILSEIWYGTAPATGANTVTINTNNAKNLMGAALTFYNVRQTLTSGLIITASGTASDVTTGATSLSATATGSSATDMCVDSLMGTDYFTGTPNGSQINIAVETNINNPETLQVSRVQGSAGSTSMGWTFGAGPRVETTVACFAQFP